MTRKRRSLSSILIPSFVPQSSPSTPTIPSAVDNDEHTPTTYTELDAADDASDWISFYSGYSGAMSPRSELSSIGPITPSRNSPPPDLLDEDPFANLSPAPSLRGSRAASPVRTVFDVFTSEPQSLGQTPRSPLAQDTSPEHDEARQLRSLRSLPTLRPLTDVPSTPPSTPVDAFRPLPRRSQTSVAPSQVQPAYARPAFAPRPSLPSLSTLTRTSIHVPKVISGRAVISNPHFC